MQLALWVVDPLFALQAVESSLRLAIGSVLGTEWERVPSVNMDQLRDRQAVDAKRRRGTLAADDLLAYLNFYDFREIIIKRWDDGFAQVFGSKRRTAVYLDTLESLRDSIAHSRPLLTFEAEMFCGISGLLRNQVTLYRTSDDPASQHYPVIESVRDHFGQTGQTYGAATVRIEVGDQVTFACHGSDVAARELEWVIWSPRMEYDPFTGTFYGVLDDPAPAKDDVLVVRGERVELTWSPPSTRSGSSVAWPSSCVRSTRATTSV